MTDCIDFLFDIFVPFVLFQILFLFFIVGNYDLIPHPSILWRLQIPPLLQMYRFSYIPYRAARRGNTGQCGWGQNKRHPLHGPVLPYRCCQEFRIGQEYR